MTKAFPLRIGWRRKKWLILNCRHFYSTIIIIIVINKKQFHELTLDFLFARCFSLSTPFLAPTFPWNVRGSARPFSFHYCFKNFRFVSFLFATNLQHFPDFLSAFYPFFFHLLFTEKTLPFSGIALFHRGKPTEWGINDMHEPSWNRNWWFFM